MTREEKLIGVCEDCKYLLMYYGFNEDWEPDGEFYYICALSDEEVKLNHTCEEYEEEE